MGFRFDLNEANNIAKFVDGDILTYFNETFYSYENFNNNIEGLIKLLKGMKRSFFTAGMRYHGSDSSASLCRRLYELKSEIEQELFFSDCVDRSFESIREKPSIKELMSILNQVYYMLGKQSYKYYALLIPSFNDSEANHFLTSEKLLTELLEFHAKDPCLILQIDRLPREDNVNLYNAFKSFRTAYRDMDEWPGILLWNEKESILVPLGENMEQIKRTLYEIFDIMHFNKNNAFKYIKNEYLPRRKQQSAYFCHLSDLHFGVASVNRKSERLLNIFDETLNDIRDETVYAVITGDLIDTPNERNTNKYHNFVGSLLDKGLESPKFVLGNHDCTESGVFFGRKKVSTVWRLSRKTEVIEDIGVILIKFDSNTEDMLACGKIGISQLKQIDRELKEYSHIENYTLIALLHHHPIEVQTPSWYEKEWYEKLLLGFEDYTQKLIDSEEFLGWLTDNNVQFVLHGHKHIPQVKIIENKGHKINIIGCGSSTGKVKHKQKEKTYITYNLLKYNVERKRLTLCTTFYEELEKEGVQHLQPKLLE